MEQQYLQELFSFQVAHEKLKNTGAGFFQLEPTEEGAKLLNSYGLHFKEQEGGFVIVAPCIKRDDTGLLELKNQFVGKEKLSFAVFTNDPYFFDHSDLPYDPPGESVYYFNNLNEHERRTRLLMSNYSVKENERVRLHTKQFSGKITKNAANEIILPCVFDSRGNRIPAPKYDLEVNEFQNTYFLDLSRLVDGLYTIEYNGERTTCYCAKASFIRRIPLLILEIFIEPEIPEKYRVVQWKNGVQYIDVKEFRLHFGIHFYYWRYKLIPKKIPLETWIKVRTNQSGYAFEPTKTQINSYQDPVLFTSQQPIDTPNDDLAINLYRLNWNEQCRFTGANKYKYCNRDYGIELNSDFWCRESVNNTYPYKCPAQYTEQLIGPLPKAEAVTTQYYKENGKPYAQMRLYLVYEDGKYVIKEEYEPAHFTCDLIEGDGDVTIEFINKVAMSYVDLYYIVVGKLPQQWMRMNKIGDSYLMEKIVTRFGYPKLQKGDRIVYWFTYQLIPGQPIYTSDTYSHLFQMSV